MELTTAALAVFEAIVRLSLGLLAIAFFLDLAALRLATGERLRRHRMVSVGWSTAPLVLLALLLAALSGTGIGL